MKCPNPEEKGSRKEVYTVIHWRCPYSLVLSASPDAIEAGEEDGEGGLRKGSRKERRGGGKGALGQE